MTISTPCAVFADVSGSLYDHPEFLMLVMRAGRPGTPRPDELIPLPEESELFLLPGRRTLALDPETGEAALLEGQAAAAFVSPGHTLAGTAAFLVDPECAKPPVLPLFSYAPLGYADGIGFVTAAKRVDEDKRQRFCGIDPKRIERGAERLLKALPGNRLAAHLAGCALKSSCPAARNLCLGRFEAPLPTSRRCNARCVGCLSLQPDDSGFPSTQTRLTFTPTAKEIVGIMSRHAAAEKRPILSFGQGCEGEPLTEAALIAEAIGLFRRGGGKGTVNVNTNASMPEAIPDLAKAGLDSIRASLVSARPELYTAYHRPAGYGFADVVQTIQAAKSAGLFVSLNLLYFPGVTDGEHEAQALFELVAEFGVDFVQLRNLNLDPELFLSIVGAIDPGPAMGLQHFRKRLKKARPGIGIGYFNPWLGGRAAGSPGRGVISPE